MVRLEERKRGERQFEAKIDKIRRFLIVFIALVAEAKSRTGGHRRSFMEHSDFHFKASL